MGAINKKYTTEEFIEKARQIHGNLYCYSNVVYVNAHTKICITCPIHGDFYQTPANHLSGKGCKKCAMDYVVSKRRLSRDEFIKRSNNVFGEGKYIYDDVVYINDKTPVKILCPKHGFFEQTPLNHMRGHGCPACAGMEKWTRERFIREGKRKYGDRYDYSNSLVKNKDEKVEIKCNDCGTSFYQSLRNHINGIQGGCPTCRYKHSAKNESVDFEEFKRRAELEHNNKYTYDQSSFTNLTHKVRIFCPKHGWFKQVAASHLQGCGCKTCRNEKFKESYLHTQEWFLKKAKESHGNRYNYDLCVYSGLEKKVSIICSKHGVFEQLAGNHLKGEGCPRCKNSIGEERISIYLSNNNIDSIRQYRIALPKHQKVIEGIFVDFYLPTLNTIIEFNGEQHYKPVEIWGGEKAFKRQQERDLSLRIYCKEKGINLIEIPYSDMGNIETILNNKLNIVNVKLK